MTKLPRATPAQCGVDPRGILSLFQKLNKLNVHSVMITRHNKVISEGFWAPYRPEYNHIQYSVSKSLISTAIGFAAADGLLSMEDRVLDFFPGYLPSEPCANMQKMQVKHLLSMSTGHLGEPKVPSDKEFKLFNCLTDYVEHEPGSFFNYNNGGVLILSAIITMLTGKTAFDYLNEKMFTPLGFSEGAWWQKWSEGYTTGLNGFNATAEDMTKFALLYLNRGSWEGRHYLPEAWVDEATSALADTRNWGRDFRDLATGAGFLELTEDNRQGYGYLFWRCVPEGAYRADGIYGQMSIVLPKENMTIVTAAGSPHPDLMLGAIWDELLPAVDRPCPDAQAAQQQLDAFLPQLALETPEGDSTSPLADTVSGIAYQMAENDLGMQRISFHFGAQPTVSITTEYGTMTAAIGYGRWLETDAQYDVDGFSCDIKNFFNDVAAAGAWQGDEFVLRLAYTRTPFTDLLRIRFEEHAIRIHFAHMVKLGRLEYDLIGLPTRVQKV